MSLTVTTDVFCDCGDWTHGTVGSRIDAKAARASAKRAGWICTRRDGKLVDVCPKCQGKEKAETMPPANSQQSGYLT